MNIKRVGIVGAGALGILVGQALTRAMGRDHVVFIADEPRCERYRQTGFVSNGEACDFSFASEPSGGPLDLIIFALKIYHLEETLPLVRPFVGEDTVLMSLMNGISSEEIIGRALGEAKVIYTVALDMDATRVGSELSFSRPGFYRIGEADGQPSERIQAIARLFDEAGIVYEIRPDILHQLWSKLMLNTGVNQTLAVLGGSYRVIHEDVQGSRALMRQAMEEVRGLALKEGVVIPEAEIDVWFAIIDGLGPDKQPSMVQDIEAGRETEVELFAGTVRKLGLKHSIPTPVNDWLYEEIMAKTARSETAPMTLSKEI